MSVLGSINFDKFIPSSIPKMKFLEKGIEWKGIKSKFKEFLNKKINDDLQQIRQYKRLLM